MKACDVREGWPPGFLTAITTLRARVLELDAVLRRSVRGLLASDLEETGTVGTVDDWYQNWLDVNEADDEIKALHSVDPDRAPRDCEERLVAAVVRREVAIARRTGNR